MSFWKRIAGFINIFQLLSGMTSVLAYVCLAAVQMRFFPMQVYTLAEGDAAQGETRAMEIKLSLGSYHTLQILQGTISTTSALLFLGRNTFCVTKKVYVNNRPAHQWCVEWTVGIMAGTLLAAATSVICVVGIVFAGIEATKALRDTACIPALDKEQLCGGVLPADLLIAEPVPMVLFRARDYLMSCLKIRPCIDACRLSWLPTKQFNNLREGGGVTCLEQTLRILVPLLYVGMYAISLFFGIPSVIQGYQLLKQIDTE